MSKTVVAKFGGTSMGSADAISKVAAIINHERPQVVVVSAMSQVTNQLEAVADQAKTWSQQELSEKLAAIQNKHTQTAKELGIYEQISGPLEQIYQDLDHDVLTMISSKSTTQKNRDKILIIGERLSSLILSALVRDALLFDAREIITNKSVGTKDSPDYEQIEKRTTAKLKPLLPKNQVIITQGFVAMHVDGHISTLGRGGSDLTAAIIGEAISADLIEIWTDVNGIFTADPRIVKDAQKINEIAYSEISELAAGGAKVLYTPSVLPARRSNIPIVIKNTFEPDGAGTLIKKSVSSKPSVRAIATKNDQSIVSVFCENMVDEPGYAAEILKVFTDHGISVDDISTSETTVSVTTEKKILEHLDLKAELAKYGTITIDNNYSIITLVGNNLRTSPQLLAKLIMLLSEQNINIRLISYGAYEHSIAIVVPDRNIHQALTVAHDNFIKEKA